MHRRDPCPHGSTRAQPWPYMRFISRAHCARVCTSMRQVIAAGEGRRFPRRRSWACGTRRPRAAPTAQIIAAGHAVRESTAAQPQHLCRVHATGRQSLLGSVQRVDGNTCPRGSARDTRARTHGDGRRLFRWFFRCRRPCSLNRLRLSSKDGVLRGDDGWIDGAGRRFGLGDVEHGLRRRCCGLRLRHRAPTLHWLGHGYCAADLLGAAVRQGRHT